MLALNKGYYCTRGCVSSGTCSIHNGGVAKLSPNRKRKATLWKRHESQTIFRPRSAILLPERTLTIEDCLTLKPLLSITLANYGALIFLETYLPKTEHGRVLIAPRQLRVPRSGGGAGRHFRFLSSQGFNGFAGRAPRGIRVTHKATSRQLRQILHVLRTV